jgi:hypothetical protein
LDEWPTQRPLPFLSEDFMTTAQLNLWHYLALLSKEDLKRLAYHAKRGTHVLCGQEASDYVDGLGGA